MSQIEPHENLDYDDPIESISNDAVKRGLSNDQIWAIWQAGLSAKSRELELEDLLISARAIAERKGEGTAWKRFSERLQKAGIGSVTARTFRVLPSDEA